MQAKRTHLCVKGVILAAHISTLSLNWKLIIFIQSLLGINLNIDCKLCSYVPFTNTTIPDVCVVCTEQTLAQLAATCRDNPIGWTGYGNCSIPIVDPDPADTFSYTLFSLFSLFPLFPLPVFLFLSSFSSKNWCTSPFFSESKISR